MSEAARKNETAAGLPLSARAGGPLRIRPAIPLAAPYEPEQAPLSERRNLVSRQKLLHRIEMEYEEMPGLRLTVPQAQRLFGLREDICVRVLSALAGAHMLQRDENVAYARHRVQP